MKGHSARRLPAGLAFVTLVMAVAAAADAPRAVRGDGESEFRPDSEGRPLAFVSIAPQAFLVDRVAGQLVTTETLVGPAQSPHTFEPTPRQMAALAGSDLYFKVGLPFEEILIARVASLNPDILIVDMSRGVTRRDIREEAWHAHGARDHGSGTMDPHTWLDPALAEIQARNVAAALKDALPSSADEIESNLSELLDELSALDSELALALAPLAGATIYVYHPAFGYFTDAYGLHQRAVETGGIEPTARGLAALIESATASGVRVIFVQPQFGTRNAETVAREIGGVAVPVDPLAYDYVNNLRDISARVAEALETEEPEDRDAESERGADQK